MVNKRNDTEELGTIDPSTFDWVQIEMKIEMKIEMNWASGGRAVRHEFGKGAPMIVAFYLLKLDIAPMSEHFRPFATRARYGKMGPIHPADFTAEIE